MLITKPQVHIISKEITLNTGEVVRAFFAIIENEGLREVRFLGTKPLKEEACSHGHKVLMLAQPKASSYFCDLFIPSIFEAVSPFYTLDFLVNQLARAPSVK